MKSRRISKSLCAALLLAASGSPFLRLRASPPPQSLQTAAELVKVDVSVADARGNFLAGLTQKDFRILDNGAEQPSTFFLPVDAPASVLVVLETGPAVYLIHDEHLAAAYSLVDGLNPGDQVGLITYDQAPRRVLAFTSDKSALLSALGAVEYNIGMGQLNFHGSLLQILDSLEPVSGKRAIVLLSTGLDTSASSGWQALTDKLRRSDVVIYPVALGGSLRASPAPKPRSSKKISPAESGATPPSSTGNPVSFAKADADLRALSSITGGMAFFPGSRDDFASIYRQIAAALRHQYVLGFVPSHDGQYHSLSVELVYSAGHLSGSGHKKAENHIYARAGYLAPAAP